MLVLWGRSTSSNVMKVIWLLETLGVPYDRRDVGGPFGQTDTPAYRAMNPTGLVPTLDDDGFVLWESNAILRYLADKHASETWPKDPRRRAAIDRWMDYQQTTLNRPQSMVFQGYVRTRPEDRDEAALRQAAAEAGRVWAVIDRALANTPYLGGDRLSLGDIAIGVHVHRWFNLPIERPETPQLRAWYDRLLQIPAYAEHIARPMV